MELWITYGMCVINNFFSYGLGHSALQSAAACEVRRGSCNQMGFMFKANWFLRLFKLGSNLQSQQSEINDFLYDP